MANFKKGDRHASRGVADNAGNWPRWRARVIVVFWLEKKADAEPIQPVPCFRAFAPNELGAALAFAEQLRGRRAAGEFVSHVTIQSELPHSIGLPGVSDPAADYAHYKRRIDPAIKLGRPSQ